jgi:hypothetical protein
METRGVLAPIALFPSSGLAAFRDLIALTIGTGHWNMDHGSPPSKRASAWHPEQ